MSVYRLARGVSLRKNEGGSGGELIVDYPLRIIRLSDGGFNAVESLCRVTAADCPQDDIISAFADDLERQGIIERIFPAAAEDKWPAVSVIIPTYNRLENLQYCLESLLNLDYPRDKMEVIVVDDGSDEPIKITSDISRIRVIRMEKNAGPGAARNEAARRAAGDILAFIDDDCTADSGWLKSIITCFNDPEVAAAGGMVVPASIETPLEKYEQCQSPLYMGTRQRKVLKGGSPSYLPTCNLLVRKTAMSSAGGFNPSLRVGEDVDLCWRMLDKGQKIYYIPEGRVMHRHRSTLLDFLFRRCDYGQSEAMLASRNPGQKRKLYYYPGNGALLALMAVSWYLAGLFPALAGGAAFGAVMVTLQGLFNYRKVKKSGCGVSASHSLTASFKSQGTGIYLFCRQFSRYYSIPGLAALLLTYPPMAMPVFLCNLIPGIVDHILKKPSISLPRFVAYYFLEDLFYQAGVYTGCIKVRTLSPLMVKFTRAGSCR